ncbi:MAG TPA: transcription termination factor Rho, partial [Ktedonobacterales bacterium]
RATSQPTQAPQDAPSDEQSFGQPTAPLANGANGANGSQGAQHPANRSAQGGATRGAIPYSPGGRGPDHRGRSETSRQPPRQPQYPQQGQPYPTGNYPGGQRPQGRDDQRGGQAYTVYSPAAPYPPADPYGQRGQRGQQDQGPRGPRNRGGQGSYQQGGYPEGQQQGRGYPQDRHDSRDPRDQRRQGGQGGRHNDQGYPEQRQSQSGYPQDRQDRRGAPTNTRGQSGRGGQPTRGRDQMALPPLYTNPNAPVDPRYAPVNQRNQPAAPQQHARIVEITGMVFPSGHGAATADLLDERTLQTTGRISLDDMRRWGLRSGDVIRGQVEERGSRRSLVALDSVNDITPESARERPHFDQLTATFPDRRVRLEQAARPISARIIDLFAPLGFGSRALIVAPPKTGKTTLIREAAESVLLGYPDAVVMAVLVGERPEEVTDLRSRLEPRGGHVYAASFDESTDRHAWLTQVAVERAKRVAESGRDAFMVLDSLTRLARAENLASRGGGRTLSGGIDAQALDTGRRAFGAARNLEEGGSITILATCLVDTGSRQDDVVYEEFKGTGNMELHLSRELSQRRLFPSVDAVKSGTRREELLLTPEELRGATTLRRLLADKPTQAATQWLLDAMERTPSNATLLNAIEQQTGVRAR